VYKHLTTIRLADKLVIPNLYSAVIEKKVEGRQMKQWGVTVPALDRHTIQATMLNWSFRIGFGGVFLTNAAIALLDPGGFVELMRSSFLGSFVTDFTPLVWLIAANDLMLGILLVWDRWKRYVRAWAGAWLFAVTLIKVSELLR
jgi:hypothetical protein